MYPSFDEILVQISDDLLHSTYNLMDENGKTLISGNFDSHDQLINIEQLIPGIYYLKVNENQLIIEKIIKL